MQRQIASHHRDRAAQTRLLSVRFDEVLQLRGARQLRIGDQRVERSGGGNEFARRLFADARNAGKIIGRIAFEAAIIGELRRLQAEAFAHGLRDRTVRGR